MLIKTFSKPNPKEIIKPNHYDLAFMVGANRQS